MRLLTDKKSYKKFKKVIKVKALLKGYKVVWQLVFAKFAHELELAYFPQYKKERKPSDDVLHTLQKDFYAKYNEGTNVAAIVRKSLKYTYNMYPYVSGEFKPVEL